MVLLWCTICWYQCHHESTTFKAILLDLGLAGTTLAWGTGRQSRPSEVTPSPWITCVGEIPVGQVSRLIPTNHRVETIKIQDLGKRRDFYIPLQNPTVSDSHVVVGYCVNRGQSVMLGGTRISDLNWLFEKTNYLGDLKGLVYSCSMQCNLLPIKHNTEALELWWQHDSGDQDTVFFHHHCQVERRSTQVIVLQDCIGTSIGDDNLSSL